jgi:hypothetical protein
MNREKLEYLAKALEAGDKINGVGFNFNTYRDTKEGCGTMGCIAGMAVAIDYDPTRNLSCEIRVTQIPELAADVLGLNRQQASQLFEPDCAFSDDAVVEPSDVTGWEAATAIRSLLNGNPDYWNHIIPESKGGLADG